jgi:hypothetical protein
MIASSSNKLRAWITLYIHGKALKNNVWNILLAHKLPFLVCFKTKKSIHGFLFLLLHPSFPFYLKNIGNFVKLNYCLIYAQERYCWILIRDSYTFLFIVIFFRFNDAVVTVPSVENERLLLSNKLNLFGLYSEILEELKVFFVF